VPFLLSSVYGSGTTFPRWQPGEGTRRSVAPLLAESLSPRQGEGPCRESHACTKKLHAIGACAVQPEGPLARRGCTARRKVNVDGFDEFYEGTRGAILRAVVLVTGSDAEAQDCVQEAYVRAAARWGTLRRDDAGGWVRRVALNLALDGHRRRSVRRRLALRVSEPPPARGPGVAHVAVVAAVRALPRAQQEAVVLHYLLDLPVAQVARELDRPEGTVKAQLSRARDQLAVLLSEQDDPAGRGHRPNGPPDRHEKRDVRGQEPEAADAGQQQYHPHQEGVVRHER
jgi:DNA-directed RNA polymerase specialized sigma24 family protein